VDTQTVLLGAGAVAVGILLVAPLSPLSKHAQAEGEGWTGTTWSPYKPRKPYYCRGGIYHPPVAGEGRSGLLAHGWAWIADPPGEVTGAGFSE
jgi:hypothetical protein